MNRQGHHDEDARDEPDFADEHTRPTFEQEHTDESTVGGDERDDKGAVDQEPPSGPV